MHCGEDTPFPSPFDELGPVPSARAAAEQLQAELRRGVIAPGLSTEVLDRPGGGKMFGVLVVQRPDGTVGVLRAFSGMLAGRWELPGFVPPIFDRTLRESVEVPGEAVVKRLTARAEARRNAPELAQLRAAVEAQRARHLQERAALRERHEQQRRLRHTRREEAAHLAPPERDAALHLLDQQSRGDKAERRRLEAQHAQEQEELAPRLARLERRLRAEDRLRRIFCSALMRRIFDSYRVPNANGEHRPLRALYPAEPPSGAGDCAGPRLLAHAFRHGLRPLALAEFWWGAPPPTGGRVAGAYYPACREKCGPLLAFMLQGLAVAPPRTFTPPAAPTAGLDVVYEDRWIVIVDKPAGLLSVPGRDPGLSDSVLTRLRTRHPDATGPLLVHRLDLDTSGLLVAALDASTHAALQRQFRDRTVDKRYAAWVSRELEEHGGTIDLALRVDLEDRPRQIHDPVHGKHAVTLWQATERDAGRTRVALTPVTGRTHQLRAHAAHPLGLNAPIVGDRLYGHPGDRLLLHAERLAFVHPATGERVAFERPAPF